MHPEILNAHKPSTLGRQLGHLAQRVDQSGIKLPHQVRDHLGDLQQADVLADAGPATKSKRHVHCVHGLELLLGGFEPPLGTELLGILTPDLLVAVGDPAVDSNVRAGGEVLSAQGRASSRDDTPQAETDGRVHAQGLLQDGLQVRQGLGLGEAGRVAESSPGVGLIQLGAQLGLHPGALDDIIVGRVEGDGGGVAAGEDVSSACAHDELDRQDVLYALLAALGGLGLGEELRGEVGLRDGLALRVVVAVDALLLGLLDALHCEGCKLADALGVVAGCYEPHEGDHRLEEAGCVAYLEDVADCLDQAEDVGALFQETKTLRVLHSRRLMSACVQLPCRPRRVSRRHALDKLKLTVISPMTSKA